MKKKYLAVTALAACMVIGLASCQTVNKDYRKVEIAELTKEETVEITFWHTMGTENQELLDAMILEFNKEWPNIKITHAAQGGYDDIRDKLIKGIPAKTLPTMAFCYPDHVATYLGANAVTPLDQFIESDLPDYALDTSDFVEGFWNEGKEYDEDGTTFSVPFSKSTEVMFYNKTMFDKEGWTVPTTWNEMWTLCETIKAKYPNVTPLGYDSDDNMYITMSAQHNIPYTSIENKFDFVNDDAKAMVKELKGYYDKGYFKTKGTSPNGAYTSTQFTDETLFMTIGSTGGTKYNCPATTEIDGVDTPAFEVGVAPMPQVDKNNPKVISQGPSITFFNSDYISDKQLCAAWMFYKHITNTKNTATYSILTGYEPVRKSAYASAEFQAHMNNPQDKYKQKLIQNTAKLTSTITDYYFTSPAFEGSSQARSSCGALLTAVLFAETTPETIDATINEQFDIAYTDCLFSVGV
ncbi:MAG: extracellular solute-binding protein [Bacilli bacterium]|nr:extracellular solute-binding protein [Bacilli bacterium]